ncbi:MAG: hypothetical protein NTX05_03860 [Fusobacteria bacterium]|nr:hypothetical protein [Fusobacteriota bacterium]
MKKVVISLCGSILVSSIIFATPVSTFPEAAIAAGTGNMAQQAALLPTARIESGSSFVSAGDSSVAKSSRPLFAQYFSDMSALPGFSLGAPSGMVPGWGTVFYGASMATSSSTNGGLDGGISLGMGYGNPFDLLGGSITLGLASVNPDEIGNEFGNAGYYSINTGHFFVDQQIGVSIGMNNFAGWLPTGAVGAPSYSVAATKIFGVPFHPIIASFGIGNGNYTDVRNSNTAEPYPFASGAIYITPQISYIIDYTSGITTTGFSIVPVYWVPVILNVGLYDLFNYIPNHTRPSISTGLSSAFTF